MNEQQRKKNGFLFGLAPIYLLPAVDHEIIDLNSYFVAFKTKFEFCEFKDHRRTSVKLQ